MQQMKMRENEIQTLLKKEISEDLQEKDEEILILRNQIESLYQERKGWELSTQQKVDAILAEKVLRFNEVK